MKILKAKLDMEDNWKGVFQVSSGESVLITCLYINLNSPHCISHKNINHEIKDIQ